jgi:hypothetical protein
MPWRTDILSTLLIAGPIAVAQAAELDYSGIRLAKTPRRRV